MRRTGVRERDCRVFQSPYRYRFSTGYTANLGVISALADHNAVVLLDADSHASIYDACSLGGAEIIRFRHNDAKDLERRMVRLGERAKEAIIIVEGIYSMLGDVAPLAEIVDIKRRLGGYLIVDEAHSFGVLGATGADWLKLSALKMMWILSLVLSVKVWPRLAVLLSVRKRWKCCATAAARIFYRLSFSVLHCDRALIVKNHCHTTRAAAKADG